MKLLSDEGLDWTTGVAQSPYEQDCESCVSYREDIAAKKDLNNNLYREYSKQFKEVSKLTNENEELKRLLVRLTPFYIRALFIEFEFKSVWDLVHGQKLAVNWPTLDEDEIDSK